MSLLKSLGQWLSNNAMGLVGTGVGLLTQAQNQRNQEKQNEFNASEAAKNRNFQAQQAQLARDYQTEFYETYQSPSAMVRQYQDAGINPVLTAGFSPNTPPAASSPGGSAASAASPNYQSISSMIEAIGSMAMLKANIDNTKSKTELNLAQAGLASSQVSLNKLSEDEILQRTRLLISQTSNEDERKGLIAMQKMSEYWNYQNLEMDKLKKDWEREYFKIYKTYPSETLWGNIRNAVEIGRIAGKSLFESLSDIINFGAKQGKSFLGNSGR